MSAATKRKPPAPAPLSGATMLALFDVFRAPTPRAFIAKACAARLLADGLVEEFKADSPLTSSPMARVIPWLRITQEGRAAVHAQVCK